MTLRPSVVSPQSMKNLRPRNGGGQPQKLMVIDCRHESHWKAIHDTQVNGVVLRRRPIRAIETFFNNALKDVFKVKDLVCTQSRLRSELINSLPIADDADDLRRKFLINDIASWMRVMITQTRSRDYRIRVCDALPTDFQADPAALKMIISYRGLDVAFRQPKDSDERSVTPYGVMLFRGKSYEGPVEWRAKINGEQPFYLTIEPHSKRRRIGI